MNPEELSDLLEALRDGTIEDAQMARLDQLLAEEPAALDYFVDRALLQADLSFKLGRQPAAPVIARRRWKPLPLLAAAAAVVVAALLLIPSRPPEPTSSYEGCAVLTRALDAAWEDPAPAPGSVLPKRRLALKSGSVQVEFFSGARVILEG